MVLNMMPLANLLRSNTQNLSLNIKVMKKNYFQPTSAMLMLSNMNTLCANSARGGDFSGGGGGNDEDGPIPD